MIENCVGNGTTVDVKVSFCRTERQRNKSKTAQIFYRKNENCQWVRMGNRASVIRACKRLLYPFTGFVFSDFWRLTVSSIQQSWRNQSINHRSLPTPFMLT